MSNFICNQCNKIFKNKSGLSGHKLSHIRKEKQLKQYSSHIDTVPNSFIENKYTRIYYKIIANARKAEYTGYSERHHILPRCLGGNNHWSNLIRLSAREHFICHCLLTKMVEVNTPPYYKLVNAIMVMKAQSNKHNNNRYINNRMYDILSQEYSRHRQKVMLAKNPRTSSVWIVNFDLKKNLIIPKNDFKLYEPDGWKLGRSFNFGIRKIKQSKINLSIKNENLLPVTKYGIIKIFRRVFNKPEEYQVTKEDFNTLRALIISELSSGLSAQQINIKYNLGYSSRGFSSHIVKTFEIKKEERL